MPRGAVPAPAAGAARRGGASGPVPSAASDASSSDSDRILLHHPDDSDDSDGDARRAFAGGDAHLLLAGGGGHDGGGSGRGVSELPAPPPALGARLDALLASYDAFMASSLRQDRALKLLQWTLWLASHAVVLHRDRQHRRQSGGGACAAVAAPQAPRPYLAQALRKLYLEVSFARYVTRVFGLPSAVAAVRTNAWAHTPAPGATALSLAPARLAALHRALGAVMAGSMVVYYPAELLAYVHWMLPPRPKPHPGPSPPRTAERWSYWSCRAWLLYLAAESLQQWLVLRETAPVPAEDKEDPSEPAQAADGAEAQQRAPPALRGYARRQLLRDALFAAPCLTWSLPQWDTQPLLPEAVVNGLMWLEALVCLWYQPKG